jgi:hypothetical protein
MNLLIVATLVIGTVAIIQMILDHLEKMAEINSWKNNGCDDGDCWRHCEQDEENEDDEEELDDKDSDENNGDYK